MKKLFLGPVVALALAAGVHAQTTLNVRDADIRAFIADAAKVTGRTFIAVASGANMNFDRLGFVAERALEQEALFAVTIPEERGAFRRFSELVGPRSVTEFNYRISDTAEAHVFVGISTSDRARSSAIAEEFEAAGFAWAADTTGVSGGFPRVVVRRDLRAG